MGEFEFKTLGEVSIWARNMKETVDEIKKTNRLMVFGSLGTFASIILEILLKANHLI